METLPETPIEKIPTSMPTPVAQGKETGPELTEELTDIVPEKHAEDEVVTSTAGKPYIKGSPTERRKREARKFPPTEKELSEIKRREIDLGNLPQKSRPRKQRPPRDLQDETSNEKADRTLEEKEVTASIESPFVEIDLDKAKVFLVLPKQKLKIDTTDQIPETLSYELQLNGEKQEVRVRVVDNNRGLVTLQENRICLHAPLKNLQVKFPDEVRSSDEDGGRTYSYNHKNENLYAFVAIGNNRGRMLYTTPLPRREVWALLHEDYELGNEPIVTEETRIWERYKPSLVDLKETGGLIIRNIRTAEVESLSCESSFSIEGERVAEDDFRQQSPLLSGSTLQIRAPRENASGWTIWVQNREAGYRIVSKKWTGEEPLSLKLPDVLPCECGEFQVDICQQDARIPEETLFFRWVPFIELEYPKQLIIPRPRYGHTPEVIKAKLGDIQEWELKTEAGQKAELTKNGFYHIQLPPTEDVLRFSIAKRGKPETNTNVRITIPRLKWKTSKQRAWSDKLQVMKREELIYGEDLLLFIRTNDFDTRYDLSAILWANDQKLHEAKFTRKGTQHIVKLNEFYDTVRQNNKALILKLEIRKAEDPELLGTPEILGFAPPPVVQPASRTKPSAYDLINMVSLPRICSALQRIKAKCPKERRICKEISQIYYDKIRSGKWTGEGLDMYKKDFVIRSLAFVKFIMDTYGDGMPIRRQKKWRARIDFIQQQYPQEFGGVFDTYSRR